MADPLSPNAALLVKLGSIARHAQELTSSGGHHFDHIALANLLDDAYDVLWMADMDAMALLPLMRPMT